VRLGFVGFGHVGRALARLLLDRREELRRRHGLEFTVTLLASARRGAQVDPAGIDLERALAEGWSARASALEGIAAAPVDLIFEATPLDPAAGEPALSHVRAALQRGVSVVTANKGPVAFAGRTLLDLARRKGAGFRFESAVADCLPVFNLAEAALPLGRVTAFRGVLNSTSNHVLQAVARGGRLEDAVVDMQRAGVAEADPAHDLDGWDQAVKAVILAGALLGRETRPAEVERTPVAAVDPAWLRAETAAGRVVRLGAAGALRGPLSVAPLSLAPGEFLASLGGTSLGLTLETELAGTLHVGIVDPGVAQTAYGMAADLVAIHHGRLTPAGRGSRLIRAPLRRRRGRRTPSARPSSGGCRPAGSGTGPATGRRDRPASPRGSSP
jgi:homoserine dehydrogenase